MVRQNFGLIRPLLLLLPLLRGCDHHPAPLVAPVNFHSPGIERCLQDMTANSYTHATNHFSLCPTELDRNDLVGALVYWKEAGRLLEYCEVPKGEEARAWRLRPKVDRSAVLTDEQISASNDLVAHRVWIGWVNRCIDSGKDYVVTLQEATAAFPKPAY